METCPSSLAAGSIVPFSFDMTIQVYWLSQFKHSTYPHPERFGKLSGFSDYKPSNLRGLTLAGVWWILHLEVWWVWISLREWHANSLEIFKKVMHRTANHLGTTMNKGYSVQKQEMYKIRWDDFGYTKHLSKRFATNQKNESGVTARHNKNIYKKHTPFGLRHTFVTLWDSLALEFRRFVLGENDWARNPSRCFNDSFMICL